MAAVVCWLVLPGSALDRTVFSLVSRGFANPPFFISGNGGHASPWSLRTFTSYGKPDKRQAPVIVSLGDDLEGFFQSNPPSPIDLAVILTNFQRLGATKAATAGILAWDDPDPIGLAALDKALGGFDSLVMAAPLSRGAVPEPMPPVFRKASVSLKSVHGDASALPIVNRIPLAGIILGGDHTLAGFQSLDSESDSGPAPLLARWEDRVVFSFALLTVLQRLDAVVDGMEIRMGEYLKLSPNGPTVPIDRFGRLTLPPKPVSPYAEISAEELIDGGDELFPKKAPEPVILRDDRSAAEPATRAFSKNLPAVIAAIASDTGLAPARDFPRLAAHFELAGLALVVGLLTAFSGFPVFSRNIGFLTIVTACLAAQLITAGFSALWLPGLPALAAVVGAFGVCLFTKVAPAVLKPPVVHPPVVKSVPVAEPAPAIAAESPATPPQKPPVGKSGQRGKKRRR